MRPDLHPHFLGRHFNACTAIDNHNRMCQFELSLDKSWVTQSGYFRLATTVVLVMGITDGDLLFFHGIPEGSANKNISTRD